MENIKQTVSADGKKLTLEIDLTKTLRPSKSGDTTIVATSGGNQMIMKPNGEPTGVKLGVNAYRK